VVEKIKELNLMAEDRLCVMQKLGKRGTKALVSLSGENVEGMLPLRPPQVCYHCFRW